MCYLFPLEATLGGLQPETLKDKIIITILVIIKITLKRLKDGARKEYEDHRRGFCQSTNHLHSDTLRSTDGTRYSSLIKGQEGQSRSHLRGYDVPEGMMFHFC